MVATSLGSRNDGRVKGSCTFCSTDLRRRHHVDLHIIVISPLNALFIPGQRPVYPNNEAIPTTEQQHGQHKGVALHLRSRSASLGNVF